MTVRFHHNKGYPNADQAVHSIWERSRVTFAQPARLKGTLPLAGCYAHEVYKGVQMVVDGVLKVDGDGNEVAFPC